ncbi:DUF1788 domain-containing protein [Clostridium perfringens]|uniref:DUF1788 domain-containing protein n=1 Tax=Clostridium perfringens TaxID=1502 RepID=UPI0013E37074|nr:DUF1788 domain-containing protein [Clostridium perfringens]MBI6022939.1 DUF1788 domain-containing protein [Clostridium perfringens]MBI6044884.1 DUF1788 domain-containing protein [Clostridium perfringens]MBI6045951.1 DUF1788 domain-containing protein [Clostridium perfringens]MDJ8925766.1 DUF1788 domain-containing protein [Clostridium perfringens]MDJ8928797.1 DUF1788 domain-containing protein [Clostridium perfringens]
MKNIYDRVDEILTKITEPNFRENKGLGNEIGFYVFDYEPEYELLVRERVKSIKERAKRVYDLNIVEFDLYEVILEILDSKGYLKKNFDMEIKRGSEQVFNATKKALRLTLDNDLVVKYISERLEGADIVFLTGIGKAWPIIRSHTILNNLHRIVEKQPLVMFFPGNYDGGTLMLFNQLKDDNYYRAFQLVDKY